MIKKAISGVLSFCLIMMLMPAQLFAASSVTSSGKLIISDKSYEIAPNIIEREYITNNENLSSQQRGHVMEIKLGEDTQIIAGYNDYNIEAIKSGNNWGMRKATEQAQAAETRTDVNVVGAVNGDFFDMSNGRPSGALVMNGTMIQKSNRPCFYIDAKGMPHITSNSSTMPDDVKEAIGGSQVLVENGKAITFNDTTTNPRTAVGIKADNTVVIYMVDGRQAPLSVGMTADELGQTMVDLGCVTALNLDGGGSSTFATQRAGEENDNRAAGLTMRCSPSDGYERTVSSSLLVVSKAKPTGEFDHAVLSPNQEVYTPGSKVKFTAIGADSAGGSAALPENGLSWEVAEGTDLGVVDAATGVFTATENKTGKVTIALKYNGETVGTTVVEIQWPDKLGFTNSSVSLDYGESSDLTFTPTYQGREVHYKSGDFVWSLNPQSYKFSTEVESYYMPNWPAGWKQIRLMLTGNIGELKTGQFRTDACIRYETRYKEAARDVSYLEDGTIEVTELVKHESATIYDASGNIVTDNITDDIANSVNGIKAEASYSFPVGKLKDNIFTADKESSLRGTVKVSLSKDSSITGEVDVVVGMDPYMLMDFEDKLDEAGNIISAEDYWTMHIGASSTASNGQLTIDEIKANRIWIRDTNGKGVALPSSLNGVVSSQSDSSVRFGDHACKLGWNFGKIADDQAVAADFGFSAAVYVDGAKPTKIGAWINVPKDLSNDDSLIKSILVGNGSIGDDNTLAYWRMDDKGTMELQEGKNVLGTTTYFQYYSYNADGTVSGSKLSDWAGKGWTWIEADISSLQMPVGVQRGYPFRIVSPQNCKKTNEDKYIYLDNLQLIYGTNTNDTNNPVIESVNEKSSGINLKTTESKPIITNKSVSFDIPLSDNKLSDKYATGVDTNSVKVYIDGRDYTKADMISETAFGCNVLFTTPELINGQHTLKIRVKDYYGNETVESYRFIIDDEAGKNSEIAVTAQAENPVPGGTISIDLTNSGEGAVSAVEATIEVSEAYAKKFAEQLETSLVYGDGYEEEKAPVVSEGKITVFCKKKIDADADNAKIATLTFTIPENARKGDTFDFSVPEGSYTNAISTETFSVEEQSVPLTADYDLNAEYAIVGIPVEFNVTDAEGNPVTDAAFYDESGAMLESTTFNTAGRRSIYAKTSDGKRSWNFDFVVCGQANDGNGMPYGVQTNISKNGANEKNITWLSAIGNSKANAYVKLAEEKTSVLASENVKGTSELITFAESTNGNAFRMNSVSLNGLKANTKYYYQVGDGEKWSDIMTFTTAPDDKNGKTNFFIFGDIQTDSTDRLTAAIRNITTGDKSYVFGIQTGDAIDNVTKFANWRGYLTTINGQTMNGIDIFHTLGNHEYYGDSEGKISGTIFGLENSVQGSFNSAEYGSVYIAEINNGGDLLQALNEVKADAAKSECAWKVLTIHEPIYGTNEEMNAEKRLKVTKLIEDSGFDFVFNGDDHAYARTYPMIGDKAQDEDSRDGVVYYVCGDLSGKDNAYNKREYHAAAISHQEYQGMYMTVEAESSKVTINAYDYNGNLLDSYTEYRTDCEMGNHTFDETSLYNLENKTLTCTLCGAEGSAKDSGYTGRLNTTGEEGEVVLAAGTVKIGWFTLGEEILHAGPNGLLHKTTTYDSATCKDDGHIVGKCECGATYTGSYTYSKGHTWDENHVCTVCGTQGINMEDVTLSLNGKYWEYTGSNIRASANAVYGDYKLVATSDRNGKDAYKSYSNNKNVGMGTVTFEGRGDFYGSKSIDFPIVPKSVTKISASKIFSTSAFIKWDAAAGAEYYRVYQKTSSGWKKIGTTTDTSINIQDLKPETEYTFKVASSTDVNGKAFNCLHWSNELVVNTKAKNAKQTEEFLSNLSGNIQVNGKSTQLPMTTVEGKYYLMLPSNVDLSALQLNLAMSDDTQTVTFMGSEGYLETKGNNVELNVPALTGKAAATSQDIMISLEGCDPMTLHIMKSENLPSIYLTSDNPDGQGRDFVDASKSNIATATMTMVNANGGTVYNGNLTQLKARGNSTFTYYDKKSYQIKLGNKSDLLGTGEQVKTWVLLAGYGDATQMHDKLIKDLAKKMGMPYVASCDWVDLYYDGEYRGIYLLSEKNSVNKTGVDITDMEKSYESVNADYGNNPQIATGSNAYGQKYQYTKDLVEPENITGGYLIERNLNTIDEASGFYTRQGGGFNVKSPEYAGNEAMKYISEYYQEFEDAVYAKDEDGNYTGYNEKTGKYYYDYCDIDSLVKTFLLQDLALNPDGFLSSCYFYKDVNGKMYAGPVWDQEMAFGTGFTIRINSDITNYHYLAEALIKIPGFKAAVESYYEETFKDLTQELVGDTGVVAEYQNKIKASTSMNYVMWPYVKIGSPNVNGHYWEEGTTYDDVVADMQHWIGRRLKKLNTLYGDGTLHTEHTYTSKVTKEATYTEEGVKTYTCTVCGDTYTEAIPKLTPPSGGGTIDLPDPDVPKDDKPDNLKEIKEDAIEKIDAIAKDNSYESKETEELERILSEAKKKIEAAESEEDVEKIVAKAKKEINALDTADEKKLIRSIENINSDTFRAKSKRSTLNGKTSIKVSWNKPGNITFDGYEVFRSTKKNSGYGTKPWYTSKKTSYNNNKSLKKGKTYYYKVRAYKVVNGKKVYTKWSTRAWRTVK